jgi:hypothetical protein
MLQRVIGMASVVAILTCAGAGGAAGEQSQTLGIQPGPPVGGHGAAANPCAAVNPCAAKNPTTAKNRALRAPAWVDGAGLPQARVDRFSGVPVSDR